MEEWLKVIFSGIGSNIITFVLGLLVGGVAGRGIEVRRNTIRAEKGQFVSENKQTDITMKAPSNGGPQVATRNEGGKIKIQ